MISLVGSAGATKASGLSGLAVGYLEIRGLCLNKFVVQTERMMFVRLLFVMARNDRFG